MQSLLKNCEWLLHWDFLQVRCPTNSVKHTVAFHQCYYAIVLKTKLVFVCQASLHAVNVTGFECQHITGDHFRDILHWLKPSIESKELHNYIVYDDSFN